MKTAVIGLGRMGQRHLQVAESLELQIVGICDQNLDTLLSSANAFNIPNNQQFSNIRDLFSQTSPECVIIATTAPSHCEYTCLAAQSGAAYVLCEKPMGISLAECDRMIQTCDKHHTRLAINHQMRFIEQYTRAKHIINQESFGKLTSITIVAGNMGFAMNGLHYFEMFRFLTDENPSEITAWFSQVKVPNPRGAHYEDRAGSLRALTPSGKRLYLEMSADQGHGVNLIYAGTYGQLISDELLGTLHLSTRKPEQRIHPTTRYAQPAISEKLSFQPIDVIAATRSVLEALFIGEDYPTAQEARQAISVLLAAYISEEEHHRSVKLDDNLPRDRTFPWA